MDSRKMRFAVKHGALVVLMLAGQAVSALAAEAPHEKIRIPVGRAEVVASDNDVKTVAIAEPKIADAAVGSARTVVVNAKSEGTTTLVVYNEGARYKVYDVEVFTPNGYRQVALHVRIAELTENAKKQLGFDFEGQFTSTQHNLDGTITGGLFTAKTAGNEDGFLTYIRTKGDLHLVTAWNAMEEKGELRTLANPTLVAKSGSEATFLSGGEFPIPIASGAGVSGIQTVTIEWKEFGVKLKFTPTVLEDGTISLKVAPEVSQIDFSNPLTIQGFDLPVLISRKASTTVNMNNGEHLVIGGLKHTESSNTVKKVPILGHIPILGFFFTDTRKDKSEKELMVVVSPEILEGASTTMPQLPTDRPEMK